MDIVTIALRIAHIVAGVLWVGGATIFFFYIEPARRFSVWTPRGSWTS